MRKTIRAFPKDALRWAYLRQSKNVQNVGVCFAPFRGHWRVHKTLLETVLLREIGARIRARRIARWIAGFRPELLWVHAEEEAVNVGFFLRRALGIPMHLTFHDAPEIAASDFIGYSRASSALYLARVRQLIRHAAALDAVSAELAEHVKALAGYDDIPSMMLPPSATRNRAGQLDTPITGGHARRIGFCGSPRVSESQWREFLALLGRLSFDFEIIAFVEQQGFFRATPAANTTIVFQGYAPTEEDIVRFFSAEQVAACYLGLWKEPGKALFCRTSLSSKLATYAAAGLPVIVDGPKESVAWSLVGQYDAGVRWDGGGESEAEIASLFGDAWVWQRKAFGMRKLQAEHLDLETNLARFSEHVANLRR